MHVCVFSCKPPGNHVDTPASDTTCCPSRDVTNAGEPATLHCCDGMYVLLVGVGACQVMWCAACQGPTRRRILTTFAALVSSMCTGVDMGAGLFERKDGYWMEAVKLEAGREEWSGRGARGFGVGLSLACQDPVGKIL